MYDILIAGGGPAGLTAALYCARAGKSVLLCERELLGGQIVYSPMVDNYPALPHVSGTALAAALTQQVEELGVTIEYAQVEAAEPTEGGFLLRTDVGNFTGTALILATGVRHRRLGLPGEDALVGCGVSYCAVCDGAFYRDREVAVVGGGDTAVRDALFLAGICKKVTLIHRRDTFRAEAALVAQLAQRENLTLCLNAVVTELHRSGAGLDGITVAYKNGKTATLRVDGLFVAIGQQSDNGPFAALARLDADGYLAANEDARTSCPGVFAAGDCRTKAVRQLTTAVGDGAVAALAACRYVEKTQAANG